MAYTLREGLHFVYPLVGQVGSSSALTPTTFMMTANSAINMVYNYQGYMWSRQHYKDFFNLSSEDKTEFKLITREPVGTVDKFYAFNRKDVENPVQPGAIGTPSLCGDCEELEGTGYVCSSCCNIMPPCTPLNMSRTLPNNEICAGQYAVTGSEIKGMGGLNGRIIHAKTEYAIDSLRVSYYRGPKHMKSFDDILPFPDAFMTARAYFVAGQITPLYGIMMQQQDLSYMSMARKELDSLKMADNIFHDNIRFDSNYPMEVKHNSF